MHAALVVASVVSAAPMLWMVLGSLKSNGQLLTNVWGVPKRLQWSNFSTAWQAGSFATYLRNSVVVNAATVLIVVVVGYLAAFCIARLGVGSTVLAGCSVLLFVPVQLFLVPIYQLETSLHLINTTIGLVLPYSAGAVPFAVVFLTLYLRTIPRELEEACQVDGAGRFRTLWEVLLPISRPAFGAVVIVTLLTTWNEFLLALTLLQDNGLRTAPVGLYNFVSAFGVQDYPVMFAALTVASVPLLVVFIVFQKQFVSGLTAGALKM
jgi:ABC-type glycerol-3-phosphate transport system permease component